MLHALVHVGSPSGNDEPQAVDVVAWALLPGARALAHRLRGLSPDVDRLVATQLWLEVRAFPWERLKKVAANVLANTRARVLASELSAEGPVARGDGGRLRVVDPHSLWWEQLSEAPLQAGPDASVELEGLIADAAATGTLSLADRDLLGVLLEQARTAGAGARRGCGGLLADRVVSQVSEEAGLSPATVRRRIRRIVVRMADAHRAGLIEAA
ncbi:hypothetical protein [Microlunatus flavus]|uniref:Uncharacterized protein n=1 Tax=Microlunatus flavus TaxID=1036181 RepID=A0A1H9MV99_9ACTN|nr:hypothetical protein [Microlunatus flavus]SER27612.1 hypothetical protein SAMN05421756_11193 [Microlunatus flavus]